MKGLVIVIPLVALVACTTQQSPTQEMTADEAARSVGPSAESTEPSLGGAGGDPSPSRDAGPLGDPQSCTNADLGFTVDYPEDWWANERVEPTFEGGTPISECQYFAPEPVELRSNAGLGPGIAVWFHTPSASAPEYQGQLIKREETSVDGRDAVVIEYEPPVGPFSPEGTVIYRYLIMTDDGILAVITDAFQHPDYEENKRILDAMMETLDFTTE